MNDNLDPVTIEPERYEFFESTPAWETTRRDFFQIVGAGVVVALLVKDVSAQQPPGGRGGGGRGGGGAAQTVGAYVHIGEDGSVTGYTGKVEIGQNIRTSLAQVIAEELHVPMTRIKMVMAETDKVPYDNGTFGSQTTPQMARMIRRAAATMRETLFDLAAEAGKVDRSKLTAADGKVTGPGNQSWDFGALTKGQKLMKAVAADPPTTAAEQWTVTGKSIPKVNGRDYVTGKHQYASDVRRPGMVFGKMLRPPSYGARLVSADTKTAEAMPGVTVVKQGQFIGALAPTAFEAAKAVDAIKAEWQPTAQVSGNDLFKHLKDRAGQGGGGGRGGGGGGRGGGGPPPNPAAVEAALKAADHSVKATYTIAYIAHFPLEPRAAVAEWSGNKLTVWTGTQAPFRVRGEVATAAGVPQENVTVIVPDMGSGYGGKHSVEAANEAARLAKAVGKPVKMVWTREEEFTWAYFRPAGVIDVAAGVKADGTLTAWDFHNYNSGGSSVQTPYTVPNPVAQFHSTDSPLKQGSYRGLAATANHFARECVMDELAAAVKMDPLAFRLKNLRNDNNPATARLRAVLEAAAKQFGWGNKPGPNRGVGLALGTEKGSYVATCAEVAIEKDDVRVVRAVTAFECGAILNPDHLKNQIEGSVIQGLGGALFEQIEFADGKILNADLTGYRVPRFKDTPILETVLLDRKDLPSAGAGETPIVAIAPAVGNAIFHATGKRIRSMPMVPNGLST